MSSTPTKADLLARIEQERDYWETLLAEVGQGRMEQPNAMGDWSFKDVAAHLLTWRQRTIARLKAAARHADPPPPPWPRHLGETDAINAWIYEQNRHRPLDEVLKGSEASFQDLAAAVAALPEEDVTRPGRFPWLDGRSLADTDLFAHLHEEHEPDIRAWIARTN